MCCSLFTGFTSTVHFAPSYCRPLKGCCWVAGGDSYSAYHLCSVHVLCVCVLLVITCCVFPACLCGRVCCVTRSTLSTLEVDMALLSVSQLTCGTWSLEWNIVLTLSLLTQHIVYQLCWWVVHVSDQSCFFMQDGVGERDVKFTEIEQTLSGMGRLEKLVLGMYRVSLR